MVGAVAASIGLIVVIAMAYRHWKEEKLSDSLVLGMQNAKEADPEKWKTEIAPHLDEQMQKYIVKNGAVMTKEDKSLKLLIDKKLAEYERK